MNTMISTYTLQRGTEIQISPLLTLDFLRLLNFTFRGTYHACFVQINEALKPENLLSTVKVSPLITEGS